MNACVSGRVETQVTPSRPCPQGAPGPEASLAAGRVVLGSEAPALWGTLGPLGSGEIERLRAQILASLLTSGANRRLHPQLSRL